MSKYIAFMDLLGTKATAIANRRRYREIIECFHNNVKFLQKKYSDKRLEINVFSDCAYLECSDIFSLCEFLKDLRRKLLFQQICFNAAICEGELETDLDYLEGDKVSIIDFKNEQVVKVYSLQSCFSGAGIYIDSDLLQDNSIRKIMLQMTVNSIYKTINRVDGKTQIVSCLDLKFGTNSIEFLVYILNLYIQCYILDKRAARYYYTLYATFIEEQSIDVLVKDEMKIIKEVIKVVKNIDAQEERNIFVMYLINRLYNAQIGNQIDVDDLQDVCEDIDDALTFIYEEIKLDKLCNLKEIDSKILNNRNKALLAEFCYRKRVNSEK